MRPLPTGPFTAFVAAGLLAAAVPAVPAFAQDKPDDRSDRSEAKEEPRVQPPPVQAAPVPPAPRPLRGYERDYRDLSRARIRHERLEKASYLGVATSPAPAPLRRQLGLPRGVGLVVDFVAPGSPAESAGLRQFDVLHKLGDQILINPQQLAVLIRTYKADDEIKLLIIRDGKPQTVSAKLIEKDLPPLEDLRLGMNEPGGEVLPPPPAAPGAPGADPLHPFNPPGRLGDPRFQNRAAGPGGLLGEAGQVVWDNGETQVALTWQGDEGEHRTLFARDKNGKVLFEGPVDTREQRQQIPADLNHLLVTLPAPFVSVATPAPATRPARKGDKGDRGDKERGKAPERDSGRDSDRPADQVGQ